MVEKHHLFDERVGIFKCFGDNTEGAD